MKALAALLAIMMMLVAPAAFSEADMADKPKTILAGPGASKTTGALSRIARGTKVKGVGIKTKLGKGVSVRLGLRKSPTDSPGMNILGGRRGLTKGRGVGPRFEFKIKF